MNRRDGGNHQESNSPIRAGSGESPGPVGAEVGRPEETRGGDRGGLIFR